MLIRCYPLGVHLKSTIVEIRCFYYLNSKIITMKNNSRIIINRDISLFVINATIFFYHLINRKGKHLIYFKCIHEHYIKHLFFIQCFYTRNLNLKHTCYRIFLLLLNDFLLNISLFSIFVNSLGIASNFCFNSDSGSVKTNL